MTSHELLQQAFALINSLSGARFMVFHAVKMGNHRKIFAVSNIKHICRTSAERELAKFQDDPRYAGEIFFIQEVEK